MNCWNNLSTIGSSITLITFGLIIKTLRIEDLIIIYRVICYRSICLEGYVIGYLSFEGYLVGGVLTLSIILSMSGKVLTITFNIIGLKAVSKSCTSGVYVIMS